jgi:serine/threonine protein kinase
MEFLNQTIGKYKLTRLIGEGGMASVYEGIHVKLGSKAAIKVLNPILARNEQLIQRFENEAVFMASLNHPNITRVIDIEEQDGVLAIVMELLEGSNLEQYVTNKHFLQAEEVKLIFTQVLSALNYAHSKGIVHRDIKPANIFKDDAFLVKVMDFGIAKNFGTGIDMTQTGAQMGTPSYMSPEQVKGDKSIDHRSDIYSLGSMLYFLLKGFPPYQSNENSSYEIFTKIVNEPIPLTGNQVFDQIIQKATLKDRNKRYQEIKYLQKDISQIQTPNSTNSFDKKKSLSFNSGYGFLSVEKDTSSQLTTIGNFEIYFKDIGSMSWFEGNKACSKIGNGWRLPSLNELRIMFENKDRIGGFSEVEYYWSTEENTIKANVIYFSTGFECLRIKQNHIKVRPVRTKE